MKLFEIAESNPSVRIGYFTPFRGPNNTPGVQLHYVLPNEEALAMHMSNAEGDERRQKRLQQMYGTPGYTTPSVGWWMSEDDYYAGKGGFGGETRQQIEQRYPNLEIMSRNEAVRKAKEQM